jgi:uncharacterized repeat protein (TIGR01451 family)/LPXTG-motif cell wall-anchored protein
MLATALLASLTTFVIGTQMAMAHHSEITASVDCTKTVAWTASAWNEDIATPERRTNNSVLVWYELPDSSTTVDVPGGAGAFNAGNNYSYGGTFAYPASNPLFITMFVQEQVGWGPNGDLAPIDTPRSVVVTRPSDCPAPGTPSVDVAPACINGDGEITVSLTVTGGQLGVDFTVTPPGGSPEVVPVPAGKTVSRTYGGFADGTYTIQITAGEQTLSKEFTVECDVPAPDLTGTPLCNEVDVNGEVTAYWFKVTNNGDGALDASWGDGAASIPAHGSIAFKSTLSPLVLTVNERRVAEVDASEETCVRTVTVVKQLIGQPPTGETYTIRVSRLVPPNFVEELTFPIDAGVPKTFTLPSTFDPAGITYKIEEVDSGTAVTHAVSPESFTLTGNLGETVNVVITNGYAAVQIEKTVSTTKVKGGDTLSYTLIAHNTGGLTLDPVVISDLLPPQLSVVSASVAGGAGDCLITRTARPQLLECVMEDALAADGFTPAITINAKVDADAPINATLLNQAKVLGTYTSASSSAAVEGGSLLRTQAANPRPEAEEELSCLPVVAGTVCDLSAKVGVLVEEGIESEPPTTTPPSGVSPIQAPPTRTLPVTGGSGFGNLLGIGFVLVSAGALLLLTRRRRSRAS